MANDIKIKAKKISDLDSGADFDLEKNGEDTYLIVAYKPSSGVGQNFRLSIKNIVDQLKSSISVLEWAREHGFTGSDDELWEMFKSGNGAGEGSTEPITDTTKYLFTYASESQEGIFYRDANNNIVGVDLNEIKNLSWTQEVIGKAPTTNKNGHGFCLRDYNTTYESSYEWDDTVLNDRVWIILPAKFYNVSQKNFIDERNGKWKFCDAMMKNPMNPPIDPITIAGLYEGQDYILVCFSEEGQTGEQFFKKIE